MTVHSEVTVVRPDGSTERHPPYSPRQLGRVIAGKRPGPPGLACHGCGGALPDDREPYRTEPRGVRLYCARVCVRSSWRTYNAGADG